MNKKITFYAMSQKGYEVLKDFIKRFGPQFVSEVITADDPFVENSFFDDIKRLCGENGIRCFDRTERFTVKGNYRFALSWKWVIKEHSNLIIFHDSLLPAYRGFAPLVSSLINGEKKIGVSAIWASSKFDEGLLISQKSLRVKYPVKIQTAIDRIIPLYCRLVNEITAKILENKRIDAKKQNEKSASYSLWLDEEDYQIHWEKPAVFLRRFIDAVGKPYKGASTFIGKEKVRIFDAEVLPDKKIENRHPGKVLFISEGFPAVVCGKNLLLIKEAVYEDSGISLFPLKKFRTRFT